MKNTTPKFTWIVIVGFPAVGKLTIAEKLCKKLSYKLFHNHQVIDFVDGVLKGEVEKSIRSKFRFDLIFKILQTYAENTVSMVTTHAYAYNYVSKHGLSDPDYLKQIERICHKNGGRCVFVSLVADKKALMERVVNESRKKFGKTRSKKEVQSFFEEFDCTTFPKLRELYQFDTTNLNPQQSMRKIMTELSKI